MEEEVDDFKESALRIELSRRGLGRAHERSGGALRRTTANGLTAEDTSFEPNNPGDGVPISRFWPP